MKETFESICWFIVALFMCGDIFGWSKGNATEASEYYRAIQAAGVRDGEHASDQMIFESQFIKTGVTSIGLEPPLPSYWDVCMEANPKLTNENMDMFTRLYACCLLYTSPSPRD